MSTEEIMMLLDDMSSLPGPLKPRGGCVGQFYGETYRRLKESDRGVRFGSVRVGCLPRDLENVSPPVLGGSVAATATAATAAAAAAGDAGQASRWPSFLWAAMMTAALTIFLVAGFAADGDNAARACCTMTAMILDRELLRGSFFQAGVHVLAPELRRRAAVHEAGHFLLAYLLGIPVSAYHVTGLEALLGGSLGGGGSTVMYYSEALPSDDEDDLTAAEINGPSEGGFAVGNAEQSSVAAGAVPAAAAVGVAASSGSGQEASFSGGSGSDGRLQQRRRRRQREVEGEAGWHARQAVADRVSVVLMGGVAAEALAFGNARGGAHDVHMLDALLQEWGLGTSTAGTAAAAAAAAVDTATAAMGTATGTAAAEGAATEKVERDSGAQRRWALAEATRLLRADEMALKRLVKAMSRRRGVGQCIAALEGQGMGGGGGSGRRGKGQQAAAVLTAKWQPSSAPGASARRSAEAVREGHVARET
ncbi:unnamed protein product [Phaeothamnion confervicola]